MMRGINEVQEGKLDAKLEVISSDEIGPLTRSFNVMVGELRMKEQLKSTFGKSLAPRIVDTLLAQVTDLGSRQREVMTVFFSDPVGFTTISERLTPSGLVNVMNRYFSLMSAPIRANHGLIDKFVTQVLAQCIVPRTVRPQPPRLRRLTHGGMVVDDLPAKERFANRHKPLMKLGPAQVKLVVGHVFEMEQTRVIKRMIRGRPLLSRGGFSDARIGEIRGLRQRRKLPLEGGPLLGRGVLLQPEIYVMNDPWRLVSKC